jgi:outer membrane protein
MRALFLVSLVGTYLAAQPLNLQSAIDLALHNRPVIQASTADVDSAKSLYKGSESFYLPQVNLNAGYGLGRSQVDGLQINDQNVSNIDSDYYGYNVGADAQQLIYDFGKTTGRIASSKELVSASQYSLVSTKSFTVLEVTTNYYDVIKTHSLIGVKEQAVEISAQQLYRAQEYFKAGVRSKIDVAFADVEYNNAELDLINAKNNFLLAKAQLEKSIGVPLNNYTISDKQLTLAYGMAHFTEKRYVLESMVDVAYQNRATLKADQSVVQSNTNKVRAAQGEYYPAIFAQGSASRQASQNSAYMMEGYSVGVAAQWNIFAGFRTDAEVENARAELLKSNANLAEERLSIMADVTRAIINNRRDYQIVNVASKNTVLAKETLELAKQRYINGLGDIIEFNQAKNNYVLAETDLINAYYDYLTSEAQIKYVTGEYDTLF